MIGIVSYGCYVPYRRLPLTVLQGKAATDGGAERSVAWSDEDSITMAIDAARSCLEGRDRGAIDTVVFATTTYAFAEKQGAALIARALGLPTNIRTVDIDHSLRGGTQALVTGIDAVASGRARESLIVVADCRLGAPGSRLEIEGGDAAAAFLIGGRECIAALERAVYRSEELVDVWRRSGERFTHQWEDRFVTQYGYLEPAAGAAKQLLEEARASSSETDWRWVLSATDARSHKSLASALGLASNQIESPLFGRVGFSGAAHAPVQFIAALDKAAAGERIAVISHGDGAEALLFQVLQPAPRSVVERALARRRPVKNLDQYRRARDFLPAEYAAADEPGISATVHFRERDEDISLMGQRCNRCGASQFPRGRVCDGCGARDQWQSEFYAERTGRVRTFTLDAFFPSPEPPTAVAIVEVENGPRIHMQVAELVPADLSLDMKMRFAFRCIHRVGGRPNYFWKCVPTEELLA